jgi:FkbH-like protein
MTGADSLGGEVRALWPRHIRDADVLRKGRKLKEELRKRPNLLPTKLAILGGSTTVEVRNALEVFLLAQGIDPTFYESGYNRYYEDILSSNPELWEFKPDIVLIHTTWQNVSRVPPLMESAAGVEECFRSEMARFEEMWERLRDSLGAIVIQNNFDLPRLRTIGNLEASESFGKVNFLLKLNAAFAEYARTHSRFLINDILYLSAEIGLPLWHDRRYWYKFHMALSPLACIAVARNVAGIVQSLYGKSKKCLILDLDNTLWGGVIGDDGVENLILGSDNPIGEAYVDFQHYLKALKERGIILAVCSKNDNHNALEGFSHPDSVLKVEDFSAFKANWNPKPENIREIATELNIGLDSMVFVDDNPAERDLVSEELPEVAVPEVGADVSNFADIIERERYFELQTLVQDDLNRSSYYKANSERDVYQGSFSNYGEFLDSLSMTAEIAPFCSVYLERITQLVNKTNQFNLTTRRYTSAEVEAISNDPSFITLYGRLADKFGDNGLVSVLIGRIVKQAVEVELWLMSCRVLKREMEYAMFDALIEQCQRLGIGRISGTYVPSKKNGMVAGHYQGLGFTRTPGNDDSRQVWQYDVPENYTARTRYIRRLETIVPTTVKACA